MRDPAKKFRRIGRFHKHTRASIEQQAEFACVVISLLAPGSVRHIEGSSSVLLAYAAATVISGDGN